MNGRQTFYLKYTLHKLYVCDVLTLFVGVVHIQQGEVVSINVHVQISSWPHLPAVWSQLDARISEELSNTHQ